MIELHISPRAKKDLAAIWAHIAADNPDAANDHHEFLIQRMISLVEQPRKGRLRPDLGIDIRALFVKNYVVIYQITADYLFVTRVIHGARDLSAQMGDESGFGQE